MRILRPFTRIIGCQLIEPWESYIFARIKSKLIKKLDNYKDTLNSALCSATQRGRVDAIRFLLNLRFPVPPISDVYDYITTYDCMAKTFKRSSSILKCFNIAVRNNNHRTMRFFHPLIDNNLLIKFADDAAECGNVRALFLILKWHECESSCDHEDLFSDISYSAGTSANLNIFRVLHEHGPRDMIDRAAAFNGLLEGKTLKKLSNKQVNDNRQIAEYLANVDSDLTLENAIDSIVRYGDLQIIKMIRDVILIDMLLTTITRAAKFGKTSVLMLILQWTITHDHHRFYVREAIRVAKENNKHKTAQKIRVKF